MTKIDAYLFDVETLRNKSMSEICDLFEEALAIIRDLDETNQIQSAIIDSLQDDGK